MTIFRLVGGTDVKPTGAIASRAAPKTAPRLIGLASNTTSTAENGRLREQRKNAWWKAEAATRYWRVRLTFHDAVEQAQRMGIPEGRHPRAAIILRLTQTTACQWSSSGVPHWRGKF
jgi:hypothetical protein